MTFGKTKFRLLMERRRERNKENERDKMKTHRTCGECISSNYHRDNRWPRWCEKRHTEVNSDNCCEDFVPKQIKDCENCESNIPYCEKRKAKINHVFGFRNFCSDFEPKEQQDEFIQSSVDENLVKLQAETIADKLVAAARKAATTGNRKNLQTYLKLRREML